MLSFSVLAGDSVHQDPAPEQKVKIRCPQMLQQIGVAAIPKP
jgi:hypothetical protein